MSLFSFAHSLYTFVSRKLGGSSNRAIARFNHIETFFLPNNDALLLICLGKHTSQLLDRRHATRITGTQSLFSSVGVRSPSKVSFTVGVFSLELIESFRMLSSASNQNLVATLPRNHRLPHSPALPSSPSPTDSHFASQVSYSTRSKPTSTDQHPDFFPSVRSFHDRIRQLRSEESRENNRFKKATSNLHNIDTDRFKTHGKISRVRSRCSTLRTKLSKLLVEGEDTSTALGISSERLYVQVNLNFAHTDHLHNSNKTELHKVRPVRSPSLLLRKQPRRWSCTPVEQIDSLSCFPIRDSSVPPISAIPSFLPPSLPFVPSSADVGMYLVSTLSNWETAYSSFLSSLAMSISDSVSSAAFSLPTTSSSELVQSVQMDEHLRNHNIIMTPIHTNHPNSLSRRSEPVQIPHTHRVLSDAQNDPCSDVAFSDSNIDELKSDYSPTLLPLLRLQLRRHVKLDARLMSFSSIRNVRLASLFTELDDLFPIVVLIAESGLNTFRSESNMRSPTPTAPPSVQPSPQFNNPNDTYLLNSSDLDHNFVEPEVKDLEMSFDEVQTSENPLSETTPRPPSLTHLPPTSPTLAVSFRPYTPSPSPPLESSSALPTTLDHRMPSRVGESASPMSSFSSPHIPSSSSALVASICGLSFPTSVGCGWSVDENMTSVGDWREECSPTALLALHSFFDEPIARHTNRRSPTTPTPPPARFVFAEKEVPEMLQKGKTDLLEMIAGGLGVVSLVVELVCSYLFVPVRNEVWNRLTSSAVFDTSGHDLWNAGKSSLWGLLFKEAERMGKKGKKEGKSGLWTKWEIGRVEESVFEDILIRGRVVIGEEREGGKEGRRGVSRKKQKQKLTQHSSLCRSSHSPTPHPPPPHTPISPLSLRLSLTPPFIPFFALPILSVVSSSLDGILEMDLNEDLSGFHLERRAWEEVEENVGVLGMSVGVGVGWGMCGVHMLEVLKEVMETVKLLW
ncbi:hypothetical protein BLNAU_4890 [Blattamonas nauphoetae]|uniref:Uncharacterized protein n=1 Tax=Blattamonas nauphoetae TaxID=2049346 RepID=A0ABQ9Y8E6_9EUKA|nr:hypothetical protein BLNAU_4890 [Blattamonas nauphoetae]